MIMGPLEQTIMLVVKRQQPKAYSGSVREEIEKFCGRVYSAPAIYVTLDRLREKRFLTMKKGEKTPVRGGRRKHYFSLTKTGTKRLENSLDTLDKLRGKAKVKAKPVVAPTEVSATI